VENRRDPRWTKNRRDPPRFRKIASGDAQQGAYHRGISPDRVTSTKYFTAYYLCQCLSFLFIFINIVFKVIRRCCLPTYNTYIYIPSSTGSVLTC
jgi:hypothetical protein